MSIKRIWHGWTTQENAEKYEKLLCEEIFPGIEAKNISGYQSVELLRLDHEDEVEFITIMTFGSINNVIAFQGEDYRRCYVPDSARRILSRWDEYACHYELKETRKY